MNVKRGLVGVGFLAICPLIIVQISVAQLSPTPPPLPPGFEEYLLQQGEFNSLSSPPSPGDGGGGGTNDPVYNPPSYDFEGLGLTVPVLLTNNQLHLTLFDNGTNATYAFTNFNYDIYGRTKFNFHYRWHELAVGSVGQTNFFITDPFPSNYFYVALLGTDYDNDGLTDGFETLISGTSTNATDTDLDGLDDFFEWRIGSNPTNSAGIGSDTSGIVNLRVHTRLK